MQIHIQGSHLRKADRDVRVCYNPIMNSVPGSRLFRKQIAIPQDHGSWIFILTPLIIGVAAGKVFTQATLGLCTAAVCVFLLRQPVTTLVKVYSGRRPSTDLTAAYFWAIGYGLLALAALADIFSLGDGYIVYLAVPGIPVFAWHLWLVSQRAERRQAGIEVIAAGVLSLAAPAAYWIGVGHYDPFGWWLWLLSWLQTAASILYAYLRLEQREWNSAPSRLERFRAGMRALAFSSFNLILSAILGQAAGLLPHLIFIPFLLQWLETLWGIDRPAVKWKPVRIGIRLMAVGVLWTGLFIICWARG